MAPRSAQVRGEPTLATFGEDQVVAELTRGLPLGPEVRVGPGDDCAVIGQPRAATWTLLKTDVVVEGVHFLPEEDLRRVGWKALCRNISDIAAMGGQPRQALVTVAAPAHAPVAGLQRLYAGLKRAAQAYGVSIVGGETSRSPGPLFVNVALTGEVKRQHCTLRSGGQPRDWILVTGRLGGSRRGKHLDFKPRLEEAQWLVQHFPPHAMMDLSDGLAADLPRLARASGCGYWVGDQLLPRTRGCTVAQAWQDGEDFELLLTVPPSYLPTIWQAWSQRFPKLPLSCIGSLTADPTQHASPLHGYDHFA